MTRPFEDTFASYILTSRQHSMEEHRVAEIDEMRREYHRRALYELLNDMRRRSTAPEAL
jgi:hypothetical protein